MAQRTTFYLATLIFGVTSLELTILHTNDVHTRFEQTDLYGGECTKELEERGRCYGGVARRMTKIKSIGNHEFDLGITDVASFLNNITFPALSCNIDSTYEPSMQGLYVCSHIFTLPSGDKIGVVGYTLQSTPDLAPTSYLVFNPEAGSDLQQGVDDLIAMGINKIIAVGHAGIEIDKAVATTIKGIDIVIGGHTNTFLYTGAPPSNEEPFGEYPLVLSHEDDASSTVLVVSAYAYSKYLGRLDVTFDDNGVVTEYKGNPILLDKNVEQDTDILKEIVDWKVEVDRIGNEIVAQTFLRLEGDYSICGTQECNLGNVLADAMVFNELSPTSSRWNDAPIAMINAGSIRSSIESGPITIDHLCRIMPYTDTLDKVTLRGKYLLQVLETSVASYEEGVPQELFLQLSGMLVIYDVTRPSGDRVVLAMVRCADCSVPTYEPLEDAKVYTIVMNIFMAGGGGGFGVIKNNKISQETGLLDIDVTRKYLNSISYVMTGKEGRQIVYTDSNPAPCYGRASRVQECICFYHSIAMLHSIFLVRCK